MRKVLFLENFCLLQYTMYVQDSLYAVMHSMIILYC